MCLAGANGDTAKQIKSLLNYLHLKNKEIHQHNQQLISNLNNLNGKVAFRVANKLYANKNGGLNQRYIAILEEFYKSEIEELDFSNSITSAEKINKWISDKTEEKIKDLISESLINIEVKALLVNAIYFKGNWVHKFDSKYTTNEKFYLYDGTEKSVQMMKLFNKRLKLKINPGDMNAVTCELLYIGHQIAMTIILPNEGVHIDEIESSLNSQVLSVIFADLNQNVKVNVFLPKFKFEQSIDLSDILSAMGAVDMFDALKANFTYMTKNQENLYISKVIHKAVIEVNEIGTEAAAASASIIVTRSAMFNNEPPPVDFICNRPFLFIIHEKFTDIVLFIGKYIN